MRSTIVLEFRAGSEDNIREYVAASAPQLGHQMAEVNDVLRARVLREPRTCKVCLKSPGKYPKASSAHSPGKSVPGLMRQTLLLVSRYPGIN